MDYFNIGDQFKGSGGTGKWTYTILKINGSKVLLESSQLDRDDFEYNRDTLNDSLKGKSFMLIKGGDYGIF